MAGLRETFYVKVIKRLLDILLSGLAIVLLSWLILISMLVVYLEDPGRVIFTQQRVCKGKKLFTIHKLRSMKLNTPDIPTHLMTNPEQYLLKSGKVFRKLSIDELPQLWDIFIGRMSIVGPRPALWNQDDLVAERDKYGANDFTPGLTGLAQISGRDELEIAEKARLDGEYCKSLRESSIKGFKMDIRCFFGSFSAVLKAKGVSEGGPQGGC